jgi:hypothetical protein
MDVNLDVKTSMPSKPPHEQTSRCLKRRRGVAKIEYMVNFNEYTRVQVGAAACSRCAGVEDSFCVLTRGFRRVF